MAKGYWPPPVYVARFSDGTECRMSIWSREGKPLDFERGRKVCCSAIGMERAFNEHAEWKTAMRVKWGAWHPDQFRAIPPAADIAHGHFEHDDRIIPDPFFTAQEAPAPARKKVSTLERLIASLDKLSADDLAALSAEVDERLCGTGEMATL